MYVFVHIKKTPQKWHKQLTKIGFCVVFETDTLGGTSHHVSSKLYHAHRCKTD